MTAHPYRVSEDALTELRAAVQVADPAADALGWILGGFTADGRYFTGDVSVTGVWHWTPDPAPRLSVAAAICDPVIDRDGMGLFAIRLVEAGRP